MSDRFVLHTSKQDIENLFDISIKRDDYWEPDYNISPGSLHPLIISQDGKRQVKRARWGLIPPDAEDERGGNENNVIPSEKVLENKWFHECVNQRRCLVPANGFYKWKSSEKEKKPFYIRLLSSKVAAFAGIYDVWISASGREVYSFAVLTTRANSLIEPVDDRMPVLLRKDHFGKWLSHSDLTKKTQEKLLLEPFALTELAVNRVSEEVNDPGNNGAELIQPIPK
jgi:putative SOS response-associated peptidase YedK